MQYVRRKVWERIGKTHQEWREWKEDNARKIEEFRIRRLYWLYEYLIRHNDSQPLAASFCHYFVRFLQQKHDSAEYAQYVQRLVEGTDRTVPFLKGLRTQLRQMGIDTKTVSISAVEEPSLGLMLQVVLPGSKSDYDSFLDILPKSYTGLVKEENELYGQNFVVPIRYRFLSDQGEVR
ncbi:hypothetical protein LRY65_00650 [Candidatus Woesebacteria bacterium]|nr:hypothetical protein [Candidatus Woesebacteria bacterium]MCD8507216.1 hypothetical protein [Candidatus Woesebacteria bacterium]MCD8526708.1 hypothetical protein [Candidatus Woesebacteria bacterium]MCD8546548.1 hypothetical protein [Candidatus Woesebacteria bacterium]